MRTPHLVKYNSHFQHHLLESTTPAQIQPSPIPSIGYYARAIYTYCGATVPLTPRRHPPSPLQGEDLPQQLNHPYLGFAIYYIQRIVWKLSTLKGGTRDYLYHEAYWITIIDKKLRMHFEAVGDIPYDPQKDIESSTSTNNPRSLRLSDIMELEVQVKAILQHPDQAVRHLAEFGQIAMHGAALLSDENERLRSEIQRQMRKRDIRPLMLVEKGPRLAEGKAGDGEGSGVQSGAT
ncbi:hypothetical protein HRG_012656 [Hirsutella rhossiliensis]